MNKRLEKENVVRRPVRRRRRRARRRPLPILLLLALGAAALIRTVSTGVPAAPVPTGSASIPPPSASFASRESLEALKELGLPELQPILDHPENYPEELLEPLVRSQEPLEFVLDYPEHKDDAPADQVEEAEQGTVPLLLQWDERWGYTWYGDDLLALSGCGPTALSMVICGLTGDKTATPWRVAEAAEAAGYYVDGVGSSWDLMRKGGEPFGVVSRELPLSETSIRQALEESPVVCSMGPGDFTTSGHFIVLTDAGPDGFQICDPNSIANSQRVWDYETLAGQIRNLWAFTV